jgi:hypothetical protein
MGHSAKVRSCTAARRHHLSLCLGLVECIDNVTVARTAHGLIGLLLEPVGEETGMDLPTFQRVDLYDSLCYEQNTHETSRWTIRIV